MNNQLFVLFVQDDSKNCLAVLKFIDEYISKINDHGIVIKIEKAAAKKSAGTVLVSALKKQGINRLPAFKRPGGEIVAGRNDIIKFIRGKIQPAEQRRRDDEDPIGTETNSNLSSFWSKELYTVKDGKVTARNDDEEQDEDQQDITRKLQDRMQKIPVHQKRSAAPMPAENITRREPPADNIAPADINIESGSAQDDRSEAFSETDIATMTGSMGNPRSHEDEMDQQMIAAWLSRI